MQHMAILKFEFKVNVIFDSLPYFMFGKTVGTLEVMDLV